MSMPLSASLSASSTPMSTPPAYLPPHTPPLSAPPTVSPAVSPSAPSSASVPPVSVPPPGADCPPTREVPHFPPVRVRGARYGLYRLVRHRGRLLAAGLAVTAATLIAAAPVSTPDPPHGTPARGQPEQTAAAPSDGTAGQGDQDAHDGRVRLTGGDGHRTGTGDAAGPTATVPVRLADAAVARLLRPGDRVDVVAVDDSDDLAQVGTAHVVARGAQVSRVPGNEPDLVRDTDAGSPRTPAPSVPADAVGDGGNGDGALVCLDVPRDGAADLARAGATARLAVVLW
ncbi:hypothetical protein GCM10010512_41840 [Streptomyces thermoviolaceus subsp. thermoviolaceus]|nr:hypothetical protein GCM10010499_17140 [Streptomyces thermoviolaceus subsp. apingens]GHB06031.1 hypothetical protein GCM10010512_41840 [Streptomyces thermoviolaceus subsp. thermoviolaceus]